VDKELAWLLCPVFGFLYALGGYRQKNWRRLGLPFVLLLASLLFGSFSWWVVLSALLLGLSLRLPFTLRGDSLYSWWGNWPYIWLAGYLMGLTSFSILGALAPCLVQGIFGTLSNVPATARFFPWKWVEASVGFALAYPFALSLQ
jgi:hypothetical protein